MKLTYWVAEVINGSECYNLRAKTKKECLEMLDTRWNKEDYKKPHKVTVEFQDSFDLLTKCLSEGRIYEGKQ